VKCVYKLVGDKLISTFKGAGRVEDKRARTVSLSFIIQSVGIRGCCDGSADYVRGTPLTDTLISQISVSVGTNLILPL
jgi:hypothetical protein